jgi:hypothetical protein
LDGDLFVEPVWFSYCSSCALATCCCWFWGGFLQPCFRGTAGVFLLASRHQLGPGRPVRAPGADLAPLPPACAGSVSWLGVALGVWLCCSLPALVFSLSPTSRAATQGLRVPVFVHSCCICLCVPCTCNYLACFATALGFAPQWFPVPLQTCSPGPAALAVLHALLVRTS